MSRVLHPTFRRVAAGATALALLLVPAASGSATAAVEGGPVVGSMKGGDPYFPYDGNGGYEVRRYRVHNTYRPGTDRLHGRTVLRVRATEALRAFHLDLVLRPDAVTVDGRRAQFEKVRPHELRVTPRTPVAAGEVFRVVVRYHGRPSTRSAEGATPGIDLYFHKPGETIAMGEPQNAAWWFPVNETPTDRARYDIRLRVPRGYVVVSGGDLVARHRTDRWVTSRWVTAEPTVSYLVFFAAGRFVVRAGATADGLPYRYAVSRRLDRDDRRRAFRFLRTTPRVITWLEDRFGPYPFDSTGGVVTGLRSYALETRTRPVYPYIGGPGDGGVLLVVHEQAHQWFGNDVVLRRWRDIWLNEGLATYAEWLWTATHGGQSVGDRLRAEYQQRPADASFWDVVVRNPGPDDMWGAPSYVRGAMTLAALRARIGPAALATLLRMWTERRGGGHGTTEQFIALVESVSRQDLDRFFAEWLSHPDRPEATAANGLG